MGVRTKIPPLLQSFIKESEGMLGTVQRMMGFGVWVQDLEEERAAGGWFLNLRRNEILIILGFLGKK